MLISKRDCGNSVIDKKVVVVIVTYLAEHWVDYCLGGLKAYFDKLTVVVIDNNSQDYTVQRIKNDYPEVILFENKENLGFGKANNIGLKYAIENDCDYVFLLNQDACVYPGAIEKLILAHKEAPKFGVISPIHLDGTGNRFDSKFFLYLTQSHGIKMIYDRIIHNKSSSVPYETKFVNAAAWLITKECLTKVGGFDPIFPHYGEDNDYLRRVREKGFKIGICSTGFINHNRDQNYKMTMIPIHMVYIKTLLKLKSSKKGLVNTFVESIFCLLVNAVKSLLKLNFKRSLNFIGIIITLLKSYSEIKKSINVEHKSCLAYLE